MFTYSYAVNRRVGYRRAGGIHTYPLLYLEVSKEMNNDKCWSHRATWWQHNYLIDIRHESHVVTSTEATFTPCPWTECGMIPAVLCLKDVWTTRSLSIALCCMQCSSVILSWCTVECSRFCYCAPPPLHRALCNSGSRERVWSLETM